MLGTLFFPSPLAPAVRKAIARACHLPCGKKWEVSGTDLRMHGTGIVDLYMLADFFHGKFR